MSGRLDERCERYLQFLNIAAGAILHHERVSERFAPCTRVAHAPVVSHTCCCSSRRQRSQASPFMRLQCCFPLPLPAAGLGLVRLQCSPYTLVATSPARRRYSAVRPVVATSRLQVHSRACTSGETRKRRRGAAVPDKRRHGGTRQPTAAAGGVRGRHGCCDGGGRGYRGGAGRGSRRRWPAGGAERAQGAGLRRARASTPAARGNTDQLYWQCRAEQGLLRWLWRFQRCDGRDADEQHWSRPHHLAA